MKVTSCYKFFFLCAALEAAIAPVILLLARKEAVNPPEFLTPGLWHAQEMIFGYTFAVVGGYLITKMKPQLLLAFMLLWLAGRLLWFIDFGLPKELVFIICSSFPFVLAALASRKFKAAKRIRNRMLTYVLLGLAGLSSLFHWFAYQQDFAMAQASIMVTLYLISLLIITMGGRLIPTASIGALREKGQEVRIPFQPHYETLGMIFIFLLMLMELLPLAKSWTALPSLALSLTLLLRLSSWKTVGIISNLSVFPLHLGYGFMALGFGFLGLSRIGFLLIPQDAIHAITLGGIGLITLTMIIRVSANRSKQPLPVNRWFALLYSFLMLAMTMRVLAHSTGMYSEWLLWGSAFLWAGAFIQFMLWLLRPSPPNKNSR